MASFWDRLLIRPVVAAPAIVPSTDAGARPGTAGADDVWEIWRRLGEVHYSTTFMARQVSRLDWKVAIGGETLDDEQADEALAIVSGPASPSEQVAAMALHIQVAGAYRYRHSTTTGWDVVPPGKASRLSGDSDEVYDVDVTTIRRDPADPKRPDSPVLAARDTARELILLGMLARAQARNRSSQRKVVLYPAEMKWADGFDFGASLQASLTAPLTNEHSAAAVAPMQIPVPSDLVSAWTTLDLSSTFDDKLPERIESVTRRLALILDHPPEILLGTADVNHWSAWQIDESTYRAHVEPLARWPAATLRRVFAELTGTPIDEVAVTPDPTPLLSRVPTVADTLSAFQLQLVSAEYARRVLGADEDDAPAGGTPPPAAPSGAVPDPGVDGARRGPVAAAVDPDTIGDTLAAIDVALYEAGRVGSEQVVTRARQRVGAKVRTAVRNDPDLTAAIDGVDNVDVVHVLGVDVAVARVDVSGVVAGTVADEVAGWWPDLLATTAARVADVVEFDYDLHPGDVDESTVLLGDLIVAAVVESIGELDSQRPAAPTEAVRRAVAIAGGGVDPAVVAALAEPSLTNPDGLALSTVVMRRMRTVHGLSARQGRWVYGDVSDRDRPHPQHRRFGGRITDANGQFVADGVRWYPGDHKGCLCTLAPAFTRIGDDDG